MKIRNSKFMVLALVAAAATVTSLLSFNSADRSPASSGEEVQASISPTAMADQRVEELLTQLTLDEKITMLGGDSSGFQTNPIPRLGIPALRTTDGPTGVRWGAHTAFPSSIALGATFNSELTTEVARALGRETRLAGRNMLLGPCINIVRTPLSGRNAETFGEDPFLNARAAESYVRGVQDEHVIATTKHFALNNQEADRFNVDVHAPTRAIHEIYFPAFQAAVAAGSWSVMAAYNKVGGTFMTENGKYLNELLKGEWGFRGFVISDWVATHSTEAAAMNGLDVEMPNGKYFGEPLKNAVIEGRVPMAVLNDKVRRVLRALVYSGAMTDDPTVADAQTVSAVESEHKKLALRAAQESIVLLKNDVVKPQVRALPLDASRLNRIALIGPSAAIARYSSGGSGHAIPADAASPLTGLKDRLGGGVRVDYAEGVRLPQDTSPIPTENLRPPKSAGSTPNVTGLKGEYFDNPDLGGEPRFTRIDSRINFDWVAGTPDASIPTDYFSIRWTGQIIPRISGRHKIIVGSDDGVRLFLNGKQVVDDWNGRSYTEHEVEINLKVGTPVEIRLEYFDSISNAKVRLEWLEPEPNFNDAIELAKKSDAAIVVVGWPYRMESEDIDRESMRLPGDQERLIQAVAAVNPRTIVVLHSGGPVDVSQWKDRVSAIVNAWFFGEQGGYALADILLGRVSPSGKLPVTFPRTREQASDYGNYPGENHRVDYREGLLVGYRFFDQKQIEPEFPFGFGLSYTDIKIESPTLRVLQAARNQAKVEVSIPVLNVGTMSGAEVVQVYVRPVNAVVFRPPKELKGFQKVSLAPGERKAALVNLDSKAFAHFDENTMKWVVPAGTFEILVGNSSRSLQSAGLVTLQ